MERRNHINGECSCLYDSSEAGYRVDTWADTQEDNTCPVSQPPVTAKNTSQDAENAAFTCSIPCFQKVLLDHKRRRLAIAIDGYCSPPFPVVHEPNVVLPHIFHTSLWHATIQTLSRRKNAPYKHPKTTGIHNQHLICSNSYIRAPSRLIR